MFFKKDSYLKESTPPFCSESFFSETLSPITTARKIAQYYQPSTLPFDLHRLCNDVGIRVETRCMEDFEEITEYKISSVLCHHSKFGWTIWIDEEKSDLQIRYAVAHELGHYFLQAKPKNKRLIISFYGDLSIQEVQADKFANELLMPEKLLREAHDRMVIPICFSLAEIFEVPEYIMRNRLEKFDLISI